MPVPKCQSRTAPGDRQGGSGTFLWRWSALKISQFAKKTAGAMGRYFEDLLMLTSGACFTAAAALAFGRPAAFAAAGACLGVYALCVARSKGGR